MAKQRIIDLPQMRGSYKIYGVVTGYEKENFFTEKPTRNGTMRRAVNFGVKINKDEDTIFVNLGGMKNDNVYFFRRADKEKGIEKDLKTVPWDQRFTFKEQGYSLIGVSTALTASENGKGKQEYERKVMTPYDACSEISANLRDDMSITVRGDLEFSEYNGNHRTNFTINNIRMARTDFDLGAEDYKPISEFHQGIIFMGIHPDENDHGRFIVDAKIVNYESIEDAEFVIYEKGLANQFRKALKPYTYIDTSGEIKVNKQTEEVETADDWWGEKNTMVTNTAPTIRELVITGANPTTIDKDTYSEEKIEEAIAKINAKNQAKDDYGSNSAWGDSKKTETFNDDDEPW